MQIFESPIKHRQVTLAPATRSQSRTPRIDPQSSAGQRNYISQDDDDDPTPEMRTTRSQSLLQEAMLACVDIYKPQYVLSKDLGIPTNVTPQQMSQRKLPMTWFREMVNSVIGDKGELLKYRHLIANPKTRDVWAHSYGNEIGRLAQGMPGQNTGTNKVVFICRDQVPCDRTKDVTYGQEDAILTYNASDMMLAIHSDASYLSEPKARSRAGGHMFMAGKEEIPLNNGAVLNILQIIKAVMSSATEAELAALFINAKTAVSMRQMLKELGHPQTRTPMQTDNSTAHALLTNIILSKALKAMDMQFHWL